MPVLSFELTSSDGNLEEKDSVDVTIYPELPVVNAGTDGQVGEAGLFQLQADVRGGFEPYTYAWTQTAGPSVSLLASDGQTPIFAAPLVDVATPLTFQLEITDSVGHGVTDSVDVTVYDTPVGALQAQAGPDFNIEEGALLQIAGRAEGGTAPYGFNWNQVGPNTEAPLGLASPTTDGSRLIVSAPAVDGNELATIGLSITDGAAGSDTDEVVAQIHDVPFAVHPGLNRDVTMGDTVQLHARATDSRWSVSYSWTQSAGDSMSIQNGLSGAASFVATVAGTFTFQVTAADRINQAIAEVTVTVLAPPPTIDAGGDVTVNVGDHVALHATTGAGVAPYAYSWSQVSGDSVVLSGQGSGNPQFTAPTTATNSPLIFEVTVTDAAGSTATDEVEVEVQALPLIADAGSPQTVDAGSTVSLHGAAVGGTGPFTYAWAGVGQGTGISLQNADSSNPTIVAPGVSAEETLQFELTVTDALGHSATEQVEVTVRAVARSGPAPTQAVQCGDRATGVPCTLFELVLTTTSLCPAEKPYNMTTIIQPTNTVPDASGQYANEIYKYCAAEKFCDENWFQATSDKPLCLDYDSALPVPTDLVCHFCCVGDGCNTLDVPPADTWYRP